jgi:hypothetical protein
MKSKKRGAFFKINIHAGNGSAQRRMKIKGFSDERNNLL